MTALALSVAAAATASVAAYASWRARKIVTELARKYADAIALVVLVARTEPPVAAPEVRAACEQLLVAHRVTATVTVGGKETIH